MIATNALVFSMFTSLQQYIAVYYPFKLKIWVTVRRTRIAVTVAYGCSMVYHTSLYLASLNITQKSLSYFLKTTVPLIAFATVIMQIAVLSKFAMKICCRAGDSLNTTDKSQKHGNLHSKKTAVISLTMTGGAVAVTISAFLNSYPKYSEVVRTLMYVMWIVTPLVYIALNWQAVLNSNRCLKIKNYCSCEKKHSENQTMELTFTITK